MTNIETFINATQLLNFMNMEKPDIDYYRLLGVDSAADQTKIKSAFNAQIVRFHPDRAEPRFKIYANKITGQLVEAKNCLLNKALRVEYDSQYQGIKENQQPSSIDEFREIFVRLADTSRETYSEYQESMESALRDAYLGHPKSMGRSQPSPVGGLKRMPSGIQAYVWTLELPKPQTEGLQTKGTQTEGLHQIKDQSIDFYV